MRFLLILVCLFYVARASPSASTVPTDHLRVRLHEEAQTAADLAAQYRFREALPHAENLLEIAQQVHGTEHEETAKAFNYVGELSYHAGDLQQAVTRFTQALFAIRALSPAEDLGRLTYLNNLSVAYKTLGLLRRAEETCEKITAIYARERLPDDRVLGVVLNNLSQIHADYGDLRTALDLADRSQVILDNNNGGPNERIDVLINLAWLHYLNLDTAAATLRLSRATAVAEEGRLHQTSRYASILRLKALVMHAQGSTGAADRLFEESLHLYESTLPPTHPHNLAVLAQYAQFLRQTGRKTLAKTIEARLRAQPQRKTGYAPYVVDLKTLLRENHKNNPPVT